MKQNETSKPCRDHEIDRAFGSRDTSRVAIQPEDGIVALAECVIVCLTRVWQSLFPLFCDKTFEFSIQTWQTC